MTIEMDTQSPKFGLLRFELLYPQAGNAEPRWHLVDWVRSRDEIPAQLLRLLKRWERVCVILKALSNPDSDTDLLSRSVYAGCLGVRLLFNGDVIGQFLPNGGKPGEPMPITPNLRSLGMRKHPPAQMTIPSEAMDQAPPPSPSSKGKKRSVTRGKPAST